MRLRGLRKNERLKDEIVRKLREGHRYEDGHDECEVARLGHGHERAGDEAHGGAEVGNRVGQPGEEADGHGVVEAGEREQQRGDGRHGRALHQQRAQVAPQARLDLVQDGERDLEVAVGHPAQETVAQARAVFQKEKRDEGNDDDGVNHVGKQAEGRAEGLLEAVVAEERVGDAAQALQQEAFFEEGQLVEEARLQRLHDAGDGVDGDLLRQGGGPAHGEGSQRGDQHGQQPEEADEDDGDGRQVAHAQPLHAVHDRAHQVGQKPPDHQVDDQPGEVPQHPGRPRQRERPQREAHHALGGHARPVVARRLRGRSGRGASSVSLGRSVSRTPLAARRRRRNRGRRRGSRRPFHE